MLIAARRQVVNQVRELADTAGLKARSVTVSALAFDQTLAGSGTRQQYGLYARPGYCEFWSQFAGRLRSIQHVPVAGTNGTAAEREKTLTSTIQRLITLTSRQDQPPPHEITMYDACDLSDGIIDKLNKRLAPHIAISDGNAGLLPNAVQAADGSRIARSVAAAALAVAAIGAGKPAVDFLNPRIGREKKSGHKRITTWAVVAAVVLIIGVAAVVADWRSKSAEIAICTQ
ncbi:MAG: hypothetical protein ACYSUD_14070, partial [Planctomycetota bacterium]